VKTTHGTPPLIAHVIFALRAGGLENGLVNLINRMPPDRYRHAVVCLTGHDGFAARLQREDVPIVDLHKRDGHDLPLYGRLWATFRHLRPTIVHTRNLVALEAQIPALAAGVRGRVHGEHGWDVHDLDGSNRRHRLLRRGLSPIVDRFVPLSAHSERYLVDQVGVPPRKVTRIVNGVDAERFHPAGRPLPVGAAPPGDKDPLPEAGFPPDAVVIGTVLRMEAVKDPMNLARAFVAALERRPDLRPRLRVVMVGNGRLYDEVRAYLRDTGAEGLARLLGHRDDTPEILRGLDLFVLPSRAEGISNTILEAMATGLPVVATRVGGNPDLVVEGETGTLVPPEDPTALAEAILAYAADPALRQRHGARARQLVEQRYTLDRMVERYLDVYDSILREGGQDELQRARRAQRTERM
jgi:sugar transferase (PEP-CTERM/EpsH1 system associated)